MIATALLVHQQCGCCCISSWVYLVIDDAPGVGHDMVVVPGKGMVAGPGSPETVAHHLHTLPASSLQLLADVISCQCGQSTTQGMP